jgi:phosphofructokinase-like protein
MPKKKATRASKATKSSPKRKGSAAKPASSAAKPASSAAKPASKGPAKRVCILTGGGDAPGLNAVLRAFVKTSEGLGIEVYGSEDGFEGLIQSGRMVRLTGDSVRGILPKGGSILGCSNRANPFAYRAPGSKELKDVSADVVDRLKRHGIDILVMVGGDGTMHHARELMKLGIDVVGVPKTIDNDLGATDYTFGFDTAVHTATWAIDALHSTAESHDRVMILELMGRYAGWISLHAGIAGGADVIAIPEIPYDIDRIVAKIEGRAKRGVHFSIVVVGEGASPKGGKRATLNKGYKGHLERLGGAGQVMASLLEGRVPHETRVTVLGHVQRGGSPSAFDRVLGTRFGVEAALMCQRRQTGQMVALRGLGLTHIPIEQAIGDAKVVTPDSDLVALARHLDIELGG